MAQRVLSRPSSYGGGGPPFWKSARPPLQVSTSALSGLACHQFMRLTQGFAVLAGLQDAGSEPPALHPLPHPTDGRAFRVQAKTSLPQLGGCETQISPGLPSLGNGLSELGKEERAQGWREVWPAKKKPQAGRGRTRHQEGCSGAEGLRQWQGWEQTGNRLGTDGCIPTIPRSQPSTPIPEARLPAAGSASVRTVKSMMREVKSKAVCWPSWTTEMQWRSP